MNRDASSELPKTVHIFPEVKLHTFPEVYMFLFFLKYIFKNVIQGVLKNFMLEFFDCWLPAPVAEERHDEEKKSQTIIFHPL